MAYSLTQGGNAIALAGLVSELLKIVGVDIIPGDLEKIIIAIGIVISWFGRQRHGDLTPLGFKKTK